MDARNHTLHLFGQYQQALEAVNFAVPELTVLNPPLWELCLLYTSDAADE